MTNEQHPHRVLVIGGGFAGLNAVKALRRAPAQVTLIDRRNFHLFQPLLYQVATGGLSPANIAAPLRGVLSRQRNCQVLMAEVVAFDLQNRQVTVRDTSFGETADEHRSVLSYDTLIVAAGATHSYFGNSDWEAVAPGLKTIEDATEIRRRVLGAFEGAELEHDPEARKALLSFVVVGGGPTGVELAGAVAEIARHSLKHDFRSIHPPDAHIRLIEAGPQVLGMYPPNLSAKAKDSLTRLGVDVCTDTRVGQITPEGVSVITAKGTDFIPARTVLWAAGVQASPLGKMLGEQTGAELDRAGRIKVAADLSLPGHREVFVLGDMASYLGADGKPLPGVAPVANKQGSFVGKLVDSRLRGRQLPTFRYRHAGDLATIGKSAAVADIGGFHFSGSLAWLLWLFVHLINIVSYRNQLLVLVQWSWSYLTYDKSARLITGGPEATVSPSATGAGRIPEVSAANPQAAAAEAAATA